MSYNNFAQVATRKAIAAVPSTRPMRKVSAAFNLKFILQTLQKSLTGAKRFRKDDAISVTNVHVSYTVRVQEGNIIVQIAADDKARVVEGLDRLKQLFKQKHMKKPIRPERGVGYLAGKKLSGLWIIQVVLIPPKGHLTILTEEMYDELDINAQAVWKGYSYSMTYETWDEEAREIGETDDRGWEVDSSETFNSLEEMIEGDSEIYNKSWLEWSSSSPEAGDWLSSEAEDDDLSDESTIYNLFLGREDDLPLSNAELRYISDTLRVHMY